MRINSRSSTKMHRALALALGTLTLLACSDQGPVDPLVVTPEFSASPYANGLATTEWQERTARGAHARQATGYFLTSGDQFRPAAPPAFGSPAFLTDLNEISVLSATRTPQQLATAQFWNLSTGTMTSSGYWNQLASTYIDENRLNERAAAHVFALMHAAMFDAGIGCWDAKYFYWYIRPSQVDAAITLPIGLPNHPSFPSGHSCNSAAATVVLAHFFPAHATELAGQMTQAGLSRMYGGIHYRFDITAGQALGAAVARLAISIDQSNGLLAAIPR